MIFKKSIAIGLLLWVGVAYTADYTGREKCASCHAAETAAWQGSHHDLAMQEATEESVLGDFNNAAFSHFGVVTRFFRKGGKFMVRTDGPDGKLHDYPVKYTFGVYPLQQYLIPFPGGRLQVLDIAWDSRPGAEGGQRWFHLHPQDKVSAGDVLHWTGPNLNWNYMCADCHSTHLQKNYDSSTQTYASTWSEIDVSCEACHGPGSDHVQWANAVSGGNENKPDNKGLTANLMERKGIHWSIDKASHKPVRSRPNTSRAEIDVCARCHSRRSPLSDDFVPGQPFMDAYHPALLTEGLYYPDGNMQDEVYVWGSFRQSKMFHQGVTCSDCHDPHKAALKTPGDQVCHQCHVSDQYAKESHHFHEPASKGSRCVGCHMPATTFMGVDVRHDHGFRVPRPDLTVSLGTPNACNQCHDDRSPEWASAQLKEWIGREPQGFQRFAGVLQVGRRQSRGAYKSLMTLALDENQPTIARATVLSYLPGAVDRSSLMALQQLLDSDDPLLRLGVLDALEVAPRRQRILAFPLVWDSVKAIRIKAARLMAGYPGDGFKPGQEQVLGQAIEEYIQAQAFNGERPEAQVNLGNLYTDLGESEKAQTAYREALRLQPAYVPAYINHAQLLSEQGREQAAQALLRRGLRQSPGSAALHHALGLSQVRMKQPTVAVASLARAARLETGNSRYQYVYAVMLQSRGRLDEAIEVLKANLENHPADMQSMVALRDYYQQAGNEKKALEIANRLKR